VHHNAIAVKVFKLSNRAPPPPACSAHPHNHIAHPTPPSLTPIWRKKEKEEEEEKVCAALPLKCRFLANILCFSGRYSHQIIGQ
jgi:hypothetical protein